MTVGEQWLDGNLKTVYGSWTMHASLLIGLVGVGPRNQASSKDMRVEEARIRRGWRLSSNCWQMQTWDAPKPS